ncbi:trehalose-phosphatase [Oxyplasma meridianum]|uniref:Trehalose 6-phosphate phosphatase n=1 Tax=Oxyplasma meridianum TaxID=3073602 RepID=A0AAX4NGR9_9ARCH
MKSIDSIIEKIKGIKPKPMIFLDYDGTLIPITSDPDACFADESLVRILKSVDSRYDLYIVTGRSYDTIRKFIPIDLNFVALHGAITRKKGGEPVAIQGYEHYVEICDSIFEKLPLIFHDFRGLVYENKKGVIGFNFWKLEDQGKIGEVSAMVKDLAESNGMDFREGKMISEIRIPGCNKGEAIRRLRSGRNAVIAGDDVTDEDSFFYNQDALLIKIGEGQTLARYRLKDYSEMRKVLEGI